MADFYCRIAEKTIGPISGVELREAARAGLVKPNTRIANDPNSQGIPAGKARGLFSPAGKALPHPAGTVVPAWHVKTPTSEAGPYELHQLLRFAQQRKLRGDMQLRQGGSAQWARADGVSALLALALSGKLGVFDNRHSLDEGRSYAERAGSGSDQTDAAVATEKISEDEILDIIGEVEPRAQSNASVTMLATPFGMDDSQVRAAKLAGAQERVNAVRRSVFYLRCAVLSSLLLALLLLLFPPFENSAITYLDLRYKPRNTSFILKLPSKVTPLGTLAGDWTIDHIRWCIEFAILGTLVSLVLVAAWMTSNKRRRAAADIIEAEVVRDPARFGSKQNLPPPLPATPCGLDGPKAVPPSRGEPRKARGGARTVAYVGASSAIAMLLVLFAAFVLQLFGLKLSLERNVRSPRSEEAAPSNTPTEEEAENELVARGEDENAGSSAPTSDASPLSSPTPQPPPVKEMKPTLPADFAFCVLTQARGPIELLRCFQFNHLMSIDNDRVAFSAGRDAIQGLNNLGLAIRQDNRGDILSGNFEMRLLWNPEPFACFRDGKALGIWVPGVGLRPAAPGEADRVLADSDDADPMGEPVGDLLATESPLESVEQQEDTQPQSKPLSSEPADGWTQAELEQVLVGPPATIEFTNNDRSVELAVTAMVYAYYNDDAHDHSKRRVRRPRGYEQTPIRREYYSAMYVEHFSKASFWSPHEKLDCLPLSELDSIFWQYEDVAYDNEYGGYGNKSVGVCAHIELTLCSQEELPEMVANIDPHLSERVSGKGKSTKSYLLFAEGTDVQESYGGFEDIIEPGDANSIRVFLIGLTVDENKLHVEELPFGRLPETLSRRSKRTSDYELLKEYKRKEHLVKKVTFHRH